LEFFAFLDSPANNSEDNTKSTEEQLNSLLSEMGSTAHLVDNESDSDDSQLHDEL